MKKLFGLLFVFVVFFSFTADFSYAQSINRQALQSGTTIETKASLEAKANAIFSSFITQLQNKQANPRSIDAYKNATDVQIAAYVQGNKDLVTIINRAKSEFSTLLNNPAAPSSNIYADFTAAIDGANRKLTADKNATLSVKNNGPLNAEVAVISKQLNDLGQERARDLINSGQGEQAAALAKQVAQQNAAQPAPTPKDKTKECFSFTEFNMGVCISDFVTWVIKSVLLEIAGFFLWLTSNMFSHVMNIGVLNFKDWAAEALYPIWGLVRQIVSLGVVFIGLYLGFMYIIGREDKFEAYIPWVIMFALFVNFSYPIARFAVDVSNVVTLNVYAATFSADVFDEKSNSTAGAIVLNKLGLKTLVTAATSVGGQGGVDLLKQVNTVPGALLTVIFVGYAAYVFFMATALIAVRTITLVMLIVASPFLFIDGVMPLLGDKAQKLRKIFFEQLAVGPVFVTLLALVLKFITIFSDKGPLGSIDAATAGNSKDVVVFFNILMMLILLHFTLKITKSVSGEIGQMATNAVGKVGGMAMGAGAGMALGGAGLLARNSVGRIASKVRDSKWVTNNQNSFIGRRAYDMSNSMAKGSYDLRNSSVVAGGMARAGMTNTGKGRTAGYDEAMEARRKDILARGSRIKTQYERDVYEDEKDEKGNQVFETYDVKDKNGKVIRQEKKAKQKLVHRKGDIDEEGVRAQERLVQGGGSLFMSKDQRGLAREALGNQADEASKKRIEEAKQKSARDAELYKSISDDPQNSDGMGFKKKDRQANYKSMLEEELKGLDKTDPERRGQQAQSLIQSLQAIAESEKAEKAAFDKQIENHLYQYTNMYGKTVDEVDANRQKFLSKLSKEEKAAVEGRVNSGAGDAFRARQERVQAVASGRKDQRDEYESELEMRKQTGDVYTDNRNAGIEQINRRYDEELRKLGSSNNQSSVIDPTTGKPFNSSPSQVDIEATEKKRADDIAKYEAFLKKKSGVTGSSSRLANFARGVGIKEESRTLSGPNFDLNLDDSLPEIPISEKNWDNYNLPPSMRNTGSQARSTVDIENERRVQQATAATNARRQMDDNARTSPARAPITSVDIDLDIPETHNPETDDVAAMAKQVADAAINKAKNGPAPGTPLLGYNQPRPSTPSSGGAAVSGRDRQGIIDALKGAKNKPGEIERIVREAQKMGLSADDIRDITENESNV